MAFSWQETGMLNSLHYTDFDHRPTVLLMVSIGSVRYNTIFREIFFITRLNVMFLLEA